ncbi:patatin-like phospholipase family protein [uncultured Kordia sp.]|uniref:patatin-like phospholipase family protein n=1 Tax=uncultured Kordia sp. TaxID=507699 RepID=UPI002629E271|nr:patatin-like phospholipase family protein [uncultured Kordia sp.]
MAEENLKKIKYLSFEGGGGKGVAYLGAVRGLEKKFNGGKLPLFNLLQRTLYKKNDKELKRRVETYIAPEDQTKKNLVGVSGTSAGAITAFMLAMGMSYNEMYAVFNTPDKVFNKQFYMKIKKPFTIPPLPTPIPTILTPPYTIDSSLSSDTIPISFFEQLFEEYKDYPVTRMWQTALKDDRLEGKLSYVKHKDYSANLGSSYLQLGGLIENFLIDKKNDPITRKIFDINAGKHIYGLLHGRGIFSGAAAREVIFSSLMRKFLFEKIGVRNKDPKKVTFEDFFLMTGVDLVVTGTNLSTQEPKLFSIYHTPDFPVIEAVSISMNLPFIFRPVYINGPVKFYKDPDYNLSYRGLYSDGGIITNLPFRVFYTLKNISISKTQAGVKREVVKEIPVCAFDYEDRFNTKYSERKWTLGFILIDQSPKEIDQERIFTNELKFRIKDDAFNLYNAFFFRGSSGQFDKEERITRKIELNITGLHLTDFASANLNDVRNNMAEYREKEEYRDESGNIRYKIVDRKEKMSLLKKKRIEEAEKKTSDHIEDFL